MRFGDSAKLLIIFILSCVKPFSWRPDSLARVAS